MLLCASCIFTGTVLGWMNGSKVITAVSRQVIKRTQPQEIFEEKDSITVLLLGCDEDRAPGGKKIITRYARSDMMLVAKFDFNNKQITGVSIPRDLKISVPGYRAHKINAYHKFGGKLLAKKAAESVIGTKIDKVIAINNSDLQQMVDLIGGIEIYVPKRMKWTDKRGGLYINLRPGLQKLNGYDAMCFVRYRYGDSDFHRQQRQKEFLLSYRDTLIENMRLLPKVCNKFHSIISDQFTPDEFAALALFVTKVSSENIRMGVIPTYEAGHYFLRIDKPMLAKTLKEFNLVDENQLFKKS